RARPVDTSGEERPLRVTNLERRHCRTAILVLHTKRDGPRWHTVEQHVCFAAEAQVLRTLPHVEGNLRFAFAGVAAVELKDAILQCQSTERFAQRCLVE